jgi:hypothetical protein
VTAFRTKFNTGTRAVRIGIDLDAIRATLRDLEEIPLKVRSKVVKKSLRTWGKLAARSAKRNILWNARNTKRAVTVKVATYPKGASNARVKRIWLGVGVREGARSPGREVKGRYGDIYPGWRAHFYEAGWTPWPKGRPTVRTWGNGMTRKERAALKAKIDKFPWAFKELGPKRQGNYKGQPASRMRAILAFVRSKNQWRKGLRRVAGGTRVYATRFLGRAGAANVARLPEILADGAREAIMEVSRGKD